MKKLLLVGAILTLAACSKVTTENYKKIEVGMDRQKLEALIGSPDKCEEKALHTNCEWRSGNKSISVTLVSGKVTLYSEEGL